MSQLDSQKIVILGGTSGIGLATAQLAAAEGATVVVASSSPERLDAALADLPVSAEGYALDVRREEAGARLSLSHRDSVGTCPFTHTRWLVEKR